MNGQKTEIVARLDTGLDAFKNAVDACPAAIASIRPTPDRWSVLDCIEHLVRAEDYLSEQLAAGTPVMPSVNQPREARILQIGTDRSHRIPAPPMSLPTGRWATLADAMHALEAARARTIRFVERFDGDLRAWQATHPIAGVVNGYEMLLIIAVHPLRHARQVDEIRATLPLA